MSDIEIRWDTNLKIVINYIIFINAIFILYIIFQCTKNSFEKNLHKFK